MHHRVFAGQNTVENYNCVGKKAQNLVCLASRGSQPKGKMLPKKQKPTKS